MNSHLIPLDSGNFLREIELPDKVVGNIAQKKGGDQTNIISIITDVKGNLINSFPGRLNFGSK